MINTIKTYLQRKYIHIWHHMILKDNYGHAQHHIHGTCKCWGGDFECGVSNEERQSCRDMVTKYRVVEALYNNAADKEFNDFVDVMEDRRFEEHLRSLSL